MPRAALDAVLRRDPRAEEEARRAVAAAPRDPVARAALALALLAARRPREALPEAEAAARAAPGRAWGERLRAAALREAGRPREALLAAEAAARLEPGSAGAQLALAIALAHAGRTDAARGPLERARALAPDDPAALCLAGELLVRRDPAGAEALHRAALRGDPTGAAPRLGLARALARQGRDREARDALAAAARRDPSIAAGRAARHRALLGLLQASAAAFLAVVGIGLGEGILSARWPSRGPELAAAAWLASAAIPAGLLAWAAVRVRRARADGPLDPEVDALARELARAGGPIAPDAAAP